MQAETNCQNVTQFTQLCGNEEKAADDFSVIFAPQFTYYQNMARILAIDYGTKRTGIAVTDPLQIIATALETVRSHDLIDFLKRYATAEAVESFVVGMPRNLNNTDTNNTPLVRGFIKLLKKNFPGTPVFEHDERFTSKMALQTMIAMGSKKSDRRDKANIDKMSATIILQSYLETLKAISFRQ